MASSTQRAIAQLQAGGNSSGPVSTTPFAHNVGIFCGGYDDTSIQGTWKSQRRYCPASFTNCSALVPSFVQTTPHPPIVTTSKLPSLDAATLIGAPDVGYKATLTFKTYSQNPEVKFYMAGLIGELIHTAPRKQLLLASRKGQIGVVGSIGKKASSGMHVYTVDMTIFPAAYTCDIAATENQYRQIYKDTSSELPTTGFSYLAKPNIVQFTVTIEITDPTFGTRQRTFTVPVIRPSPDTTGLVCPSPTPAETASPTPAETASPTPAETASPTPAETA